MGLRVEDEARTQGGEGGTGGEKMIASVLHVIGGRESHKLELY